MTETITASQLRAAADLIEDPERWTERAWARAADGSVVAPRSPHAVRWCSSGAVLLHVRGIDITSALDAIDPERPALTIINDRKGHAAAVAELRRLADLADAREGTATA